MLADEYILIFLSLSAVAPADVILFSFLLLTSSSYFQSAAVPGRTFNEYQHSSKPCPLYAIMKFHLIISLAFIFYTIISCRTSNSTKGSYPDCTSSDIEIIDTCLIGLTLLEAVNKIHIDTSQLRAFDEPPAIIRGVNIYLDTCRIRLYVDRTSIMDASGTNYDVYSVHYSKILNKRIIGVAWQKYKDKEVTKRKSIGKVINYWGD